ncbi:hypothetical protein PY365_04840 [Roseiarcaceae bacterium H3SJ34-1]|uniref:hypothetical protein n=1 Tax=Terripilifer ovatus TaxID=3032367 RepID=UPI003AB968C1|nr:hypothetical protein [Roseiarcaceae bacterium H3SJ34-1]
MQDDISTNQLLDADVGQGGRTKEAWATPAFKSFDARDAELSGPPIPDLPVLGS